MSKGKITDKQREILEYIKDTMRGEDFTAGLFRELLNGMAFTAKQSNIEKIDKNNDENKKDEK